MSMQYVRYPANGGGSSGVTSLNALTGALSLVAGANITITPSGSTIEIASTGSTPGGTNDQIQFNDGGAFGGFGNWNGTTATINALTVSAGPLTLNGNVGFFGTTPVAQQTGNIFTALSNYGLVTSPSLASANIPNNAANTTGTAANVTATSNSTLVTLSALSLPYSQITGAPAAGITALTGDGTATGPGSAVLTLTTVNANVGSFGTATQVGSFTVNAKGLVTAAANTSIQIAESQVTNLVNDLAGKQPVGNYITALTGDVTASGPGSAVATLATVATPGTYTSVTVNAKGLVTAGTSVTSPAPGSTDNENATVTASVSSNILTVTLQTLAGATPSGGSPVKFAFRGVNTTVYTVQSAIATTTVTFAATSSMGIADLNNHNIYVYAVYTIGGGVEIAASTATFDEGSLHPVTAEGGGTATSNELLYGTTARSNAAIRLIGKVIAAYTAGTGWNIAISNNLISSVPTRIGLFATRLAYASSSQTLANGVVTKIDFDTVTFDTNNAWDATNFHYIAAVDGFYRFDLTVEFNTITSGQAQILYNVNGGTPVSLQNGVGVIAHILCGSDLVQLSAGDFIEFSAFQNSGVGVGLAPSGATSTHVNITLVGTA